MGDNYGASYQIKSNNMDLIPFLYRNSALDSYKNAPSRALTSPHPTHPLLPLPQVLSLAYSTALPMRSSLVSFESNESPAFVQFQNADGQVHKTPYPPFFARCVGLRFYY